MIYLTALLATSIYLSKKALTGALIAKETPIKVPAEYSDYGKVFSQNLAIELVKQTWINNNAIGLREEKQPFNSLINNLCLVELEVFKTYIDTYLKSSFICYFKSSASAPIVFN